MRWGGWIIKPVGYEDPELAWVVRDQMQADTARRQLNEWLAALPREGVKITVTYQSPTIQ